MYSPSKPPSAVLAASAPAQTCACVLVRTQQPDHSRAAATCAPCTLPRLLLIRCQSPQRPSPPLPIIPPQLPPVPVADAMPQRPSPSPRPAIHVPPPQLPGSFWICTRVLVRSEEHHPLERSSAAAAAACARAASALAEQVARRPQPEAQGRGGLAARGLAAAHVALKLRLCMRQKQGVDGRGGQYPNIWKCAVHAPAVWLSRRACCPPQTPFCQHPRTIKALALAYAPSTPPPLTHAPP